MSFQVFQGCLDFPPAPVCSIFIKFQMLPTISVLIPLTSLITDHLAKLSYQLFTDETRASLSEPIIESLSFSFHLNSNFQLLSAPLHPPLPWLLFSSSPLISLEPSIWELLSSGTGGVFPKKPRLLQARYHHYKWKSLPFLQPWLPSLGHLCATANQNGCIWNCLLL